MNNLLNEFDISLYDKTHPIVIYGAGVFGEYTLRALEARNIAPVCFCDRDLAGTQYLGYDVKTPEYLMEHPEIITLLAVGADYLEAKAYVESRNIGNLYGIYKLCFIDTVFDTGILSAQARDINYYGKLYQFGMHFRDDEKQLKLFAMDWVITERCSLKCRECSNLMQYYQSPVHYDKDFLISEVNQLLQIVDELMDLRLLGGEPFTNPDMPYLLKYFLEEEKINNFTIYTNGTIIPNEEMIALMQHPKVSCQVSDYGEKVKNFSKIIDLFEKKKIRYNIEKMDFWYELGGLFNRDMSISDMKKNFKECFCNRLLTMMHGKIYRCPYSAHGRNLGAIPAHEDDEVDIFDVKTAREKLRKLCFYKDFDYACGYCNGRNWQKAKVPVAEQIKQPLPYTHYDKT